MKFPADYAVHKGTDFHRVAVVQTVKTAAGGEFRIGRSARRIRGLRKGQKIEKEARPVCIHTIELLELQKERLILRVNCGKGTYIRSLASDIGRNLGCGAHVESLRRLQNGPFSVKEALLGDQLTEKEEAAALIRNHLIPVEKVLEDIV